MSASIPSTPGRAWQPPEPAALAAELPQYDVLRLLGRGGMGAVYLARQKSLNREVAIKILPPTIEDGDMHFAERFKAEAQAMARLEHPGIVAVYDAGETPGGLLYFVMQYVQGTDVQQMIAASGRLPPEHAHAIAAHVCDALAYAHANGIIHRDIKPANVMVDTQGRVKVADFGLAKAASESTGFTRSNMAVGTPDFVAPEALITGMNVDGRADLYAVGVMLYQMLTGEIPRGAWMAPSIRVPGVDPRFDPIVIKALQTDREARHGSATELRQHLDTLLMPAVPAPDLQRYSSAGMVKESRTSFPTRSPAPGGAAARPGGADKNVRSKSAPPPAKSKTPLFIGLGAAAAIGIGAFVMLSGGKAAKQSSPLAPSSGTSAAKTAEPAQGTERTTLPPPVKVTEPPKPAPKPAVVAKAPEPPKSEPAKPTAAEPKQEAPKPAMAEVGVKALADSGKPAPIVVQPSGLPPKATETAAPPSPTLPVSSSPSLPLELAALDQQLQKLTAERVTAPFEADVAKLNTSYLGGIDRKLAEEKAAGHLDGVLALEAEKKRIAEKQPVPTAEDDATSTTTPAVLKELRKIYREALAKLETARAANLKALTDPLTARLSTLESDLTKKDRIADAQTVREYRETLGRAAAPPAAADGPTTTTPPKAALAGASALPSAPAATKDKPFINSLGMKFVPVPGTEVLFCIHETRRKDYAVFAEANPETDGSWKNVASEIPLAGRPGEDHPVVLVNWEDAKAFCNWLNGKENFSYRLPTDREWSVAVGIGRLEKEKQGATPEYYSGAITDVFPWGEGWPPPKQAGNYADASCAKHFGRQSIEGYEDGFPGTAPVMSFKPNKLGIFDMGGNVWEWCGDWYNDARNEKVARGYSWQAFEKTTSLSSARGKYPPRLRQDYRGFRIVIDLKPPAASEKAKETKPAPAASPPARPAAAVKSDFTNSLGMKFVKVPGTKVLFCIHETRKGDYAKFAAETPELDKEWQKKDTYGVELELADDHPVSRLSYENAIQFCSWLGRKEGRAYRLPSDEEWSIAVGLGRLEKRGKDSVPETLEGDVKGVFPWGDDFPPVTKDRAGNYADETFHAKYPSRQPPVWIAGYSDGFAGTSPVMSFAPNQLGLYDMGGNVSEWVQDWWNGQQTHRVVRGGSIFSGTLPEVQSSRRDKIEPHFRATLRHIFGFRVVLEQVAP